MGEMTLRSEDKIGLAAAIVLHIALVLVLALQFLFFAQSPISPERMTVNLATEVSLQSTAPDPVEESRAAIAPVLGEEVTPETEPEAAEPVEEEAPPPVPSNQIAEREKPIQPPDTRSRRRPDNRDEATSRQVASNASGSRIGDNFLDGQGESTQTDETEPTAPLFGRRERAALSSAITRQLRPHWSAPTGVDAERLVSTVSWRLNRDGSLRGNPRCRTDPRSITASNRPQAGLHCERAIRAVQLAAPFNLPEQFYSRWDELEWQFDRRL